MPWELKDIKSPVPDAIISAADSVGSIAKSIGPVLSTAKALLDVAKIFVQSQADLYGPLVTAVIDELENTINNLFGTGVYTLTVHAWDIEGRVSVDDFGVPMLGPSQCVQYAASSLDDEGDTERPQFSDSAIVTGYGLLVTAPTIAGFTQIIQNLMAVFTIPEFEWVLGKAGENQIAGGPPSRRPDWQSLRFNSIESLADLQRYMVDMLNTMRGYLTTADDNLTNLIDLVGEKVSVIEDQVNALLDLIDQLKASASASGIYFLDIPSGTGGNAKIKSELLSLNVGTDTMYSALALFVGGGPSLQVVDTFKALMV